jgi:hypothetical protein
MAHGHPLLDSDGQREERAAQVVQSVLEADIDTMTDQGEEPALPAGEVNLATACLRAESVRRSDKSMAGMRVKSKLMFTFRSGAQRPKVNWKDCDLDCEICGTSRL